MLSAKCYIMNLLLSNLYEEINQCFKFYLKKHLIYAHIINCVPFRWRHDTFDLFGTQVITLKIIIAERGFWDLNRASL